MEFPEWYGELGAILYDELMNTRSAECVRWNALPSPWGSSHVVCIEVL